MQLSRRFRNLLPAIATLGVLSLGSSLISDQPRAGAQTKVQTCPSTDSGLKLPAGFCATIFADNIGHARHMVVSSSGVVYVNTWSGDYYPPGQKSPESGFLVALQDKTGDGKADTTERFGETAATGGAGGTGIALYKGALYAEINDRIVRYALGRLGRAQGLPPPWLPDCHSAAIIPCTRSPLRRRLHVCRCGNRDQLLPAEKPNPQIPRH